MTFGDHGQQAPTHEADRPRVSAAEPPLSEVHHVPVASLLPGDSPRRKTQDEEHVRLLAESDADLPPLVVHRATMQIVDGLHRLKAAVVRGETEVAVRFFDGPVEDAFVLAVEANVRHGLPLSLAERRAAAIRILGSHPGWSDRSIALVTGLTSKTVGAQRKKLGGVGEAATRIGRDGRARPLNSAEGRRIAGQLILESPHASLRAIAKQAGVSPGTVRDVRARLDRGEDIVPDRRRGEKPPAPLAAEAASWLEPRRAGLPDWAADDRPECPADDFDRVDIFRSMCRDPSLRLSEDGRQLLRMMEMHVLHPQRWDNIARSVPRHRAEVISALAMECALQWQRFAARVEADEVAVVPAA
ncbi:ParB N-terminal domain-containing protein [Streptomyces sp. NPDC050997]|uniref:ParB/RepB/Spo0J family partition protein n=1 Tax=Streptomyces sp. NPDC050997 TaxID=3155519 RepID=UPI003436E264